MKGETFEIELVDGTKKEATVITIIKSEEKNTEYIYYSVNDDDDADGNASIFSSKIVNKDGQDTIVNLDSEEERQYAYNLFSETYKKLR